MAIDWISYRATQFSNRYYNRDWHPELLVMPKYEGDSERWKLAKKEADKSLATMQIDIALQTLERQSPDILKGFLVRFQKLIKRGGN